MSDILRRGENMKYLVSESEMQRCDQNTINQIGIPALVLMERAALSVHDRICSILKEMACECPEILIMAGMGNNGADGLALARMLSDSRIKVCLWLVGDENKASAQWKTQKHILEHYRIAFCEKPAKEKYTILVDALFGVGLTRPVTGAYADAVGLFNLIEGYKIALDVPSGVSSDTGAVLGCAVKAQETVTFAFEKRGLYLFPGQEYAGRVLCAEIGITSFGFMGSEPEMFYWESGDILKLMPERKADGNKGTFGKVLLVAGSDGMAGAAIMAARAAYRTGVGMVKVITPDSNRSILQETVPEAMYGTFDRLAESVEWADVIVIGPGLSCKEEAKEALRYLILSTGKPLVIDADGLNLLAEDETLKQALANREGACVLTPHMGELSRLTGRSVQDLKCRTWEYGKALAEQLHCIVVAKDARTFICMPGHKVCVNLYGNEGMATAGSGDVLAGVTGAVLALGRSLDCFDMACLGVLLHALAGDFAKQKIGSHGCMALDIADAVADVIKEFENTI